MISIQCPSCRRLHQAPESLLGKEVKCKDCGTSFVAQTPVQPAMGPQGPAAARQRPLAPGAPAPQPARPRRFVKPLIVAGGVIVGLGALACVIIFAVLPALSGGLPGWTRDYILKDVTSITFTNLAELRRGAEDAGITPQDLEAKRVFGSKLDSEDVEAMFNANSKDVFLTVIRTVEDTDLSDAFKYEKSDLKEYKDNEYAKIDGLGNQYVCKTADRTFCICSGNKAKEEIEDLIDRLDEGKTYDLPKDFQEAVDYVSSMQRFSVSVSTDRDADWKAKGEGSSLASSVEARNITIYEKEKTAEKQHETLLKQYEKKIGAIEKALEKAKDKDRDKVEAYLLMQKMEEVGEPKLSGNVIKRSASVSSSEIRSLLGLGDKVSREELQKASEDAKKVARALMGD